MFELNTIADAETFVVKLRHPVTGAPLGASITVAGPTHPERRRWTLERARRVRRELERDGRFRAGDPEDDEAEQLDRLVVCTVAIEGFSEGGAPIELTPANVRRIYAQAWIRDQVLEDLDKRANFVRSSATS